MTSRFQNHDQEFVVVFHAVDTVDAESIDDSGNPPKPVTPEDVATYAVERMMNHGGPHHVAVDVKEEGGPTHRFEVYLCDGQWLCEPRDEEDEWCK